MEIGENNIVTIRRDCRIGAIQYNSVFLIGINPFKFTSFFVLSFWKGEGGVRIFLHNKEPLVESNIHTEEKNLSSLQINIRIMPNIHLIF